VRITQKTNLLIFNLFVSISPKKQLYFAFKHISVMTHTLILRLLHERCVDFMQLRAKCDNHIKMSQTVKRLLKGLV